MLIYNLQCVVKESRFAVVLPSTSATPVPPAEGGWGGGSDIVLVLNKYSNICGKAAEQIKSHSSFK